MAEFVFVPDAEAETVLRSAGLSVLAHAIDGELPKIGDHISFPQSPMLTFRIVDRWLRIGEETASHAGTYSSRRPRIRSIRPRPIESAWAHVVALAHEARFERRVSGLQ